jgi:hypothetical protein
MGDQTLLASPSATSFPFRTQRLGLVAWGLVLAGIALLTLFGINKHHGARARSEVDLAFCLACAAPCARWATPPPLPSAVTQRMMFLQSLLSCRQPL